MDYKIIDVVSNLIFPSFNYFFIFFKSYFKSRWQHPISLNLPPPPAPPHPLPHGESPEKRNEIQDKGITLGNSSVRFVTLHVPAVQKVSLLNRG